ncbi:MAG: TIGR04290 family methyltransferase [Gammaproteobacteria bacterium]
MIATDTRTPAQAIQELGPWFHNLHLPGGEQTAPDHAYGDFPAFKWRQIEPHIPRDLQGATVLDIGCNAGFYSFELARRGARVTAIDVDPHYLAQARWAARQLGLEAQVSFRQMQIYEIADLPGRFDWIWLMGVLYHLRHPLLALDIVRRKCADRMVLQTMTMPETEQLDTPPDLGLDERDRLQSPGWPRMAFIEHRLAGDPTNWWAPNAACVLAMARSAGFEVQRQLTHETWLCRAGDSLDPFAAREMDAIVGDGSPSGRECW